MRGVSEQLIDRTRLAQVRAELGANFQRVLGYYREDGEKTIAQIEEAMRDRSAVALVRPAHTLKGESLQFGAEPLGLAAERIEKAARRAVEARNFPDAVLIDVVSLRELFTNTLAAFDEAVPPPAPVRRTFGFGRKVA